MKTIVIDPGHGGPDPGTLAGGIREADYQLAVALLLRDYLLVLYPDLRVIVTRADDQAVFPGGADWQELRARAAVANEAEADLLFSCHHDAVDKPGPNGGALYVYGTTSWQPAIGPGGEINHAAPNSYRLAERMLPVLASGLGRLGLACNGIRTGDFQVLDDCNGPAVLVEGFFASNPRDASIAKGDGAQAALAMTYARMLGTSLEIPTRPAWKVPRVLVILPGGQEIWGELRKGETWCPLSGARRPGLFGGQLWVPVRQVAEAMDRRAIWTGDPPMVRIV